MMSMTLEDAIQYCFEIERENLDIIYDDNTTDLEYVKQCAECAAKHRLIAIWLEELKRRREQSEIIYCKDCAYNEAPSDSGNVLCRHGHGFFQLYDFCSEAEIMDVMEYPQVDGVTPSVIVAKRKEGEEDA